MGLGIPFETDSPPGETSEYRILHFLLSEPKTDLEPAAKIGVMVMLLIFVAVSAVGLVAFGMSFIPGFVSSRSRRAVRISGGLLATPSLVLGALILILSFTILKEPPTLPELQREFASKRPDLERIIQMSDEDDQFSRIAPTFLDRNSNSPSGPGRFMENDARAGLPKARWDTYRKLYSRDGIKLGIQRDKLGDAFIMVDSVGLLNRGHVSGYLHCRPDHSAGEYRFQPCSSTAEQGERGYDPRTREEAYSFRHLGNAWYAYDEGPS